MNTFEEYLGLNKSAGGTGRFSLKDSKESHSKARKLTEIKARVSSMRSCQWRRSNGVRKGEGREHGFCGSGGNLLSMVQIQVFWTLPRQFFILKDCVNNINNISKLSNNFIKNLPPSKYLLQYFLERKIKISENELISSRFLIVFVAGPGCHV